MRLTLAILFAAAVLVSGSLGAQSLEESYAKLCPQPAMANDEACLALKQAVITKQGEEKPLASASKPSEVARGVTDRIWGPMARLAGTAWAVQQANGAWVVDRFVWVEDGTAIKYVGGIQGFPNTEIVFRPGREAGTLAAVVQELGTKKKVLFRFNDEGVVVSDWYSMFTTFGMGGMSIRHEFRLTADGIYQSRSAGDATGGRPDFPPLHSYFRPYSDPEVAQITAQSKEIIAAVTEEAKAKEAAEEQLRKLEARQRSQERAAMFGAVLQGVAQGAAEVDAGGYAEAQANLDATVANIQYAADVERQQQALAAQQEQARAAEQQRQQLAENARWVAEKEQAAAEYRSGQVEAAAAREAQLGAQQQADAQQRVAAEAQRRSVEQAATVQRQKAQSAALAERKPVTAQPVAQRIEPGASTNHAPQAPSGQTASGGSSQLYVFFIVLGGQTVAFEGPLVLTLAESEAMEARLRNEAPSKYGAGASVDRRWRGPGTCLFVYQIPGEPLYKLGSGNGSVDTERSKNGQVSNGKATIHRDVVCSTNN